MIEAEPITQLMSHAAEGRQYLTFLLQGEEFGIDILQVQEIRGLSKITPIPNTPEHVRGVINLRGTVVPIIDLRLRFNLPPAEYDQFTVIVVVNVASKVTGLVVDAVSDVMNVDEENLEPAPSFDQDASTAAVQGIAKAGDRLITLLNMSQLVGKGTQEPAVPVLETA